MRKQKRTDRPVSIFEMVFGLLAVTIGIVACMVHNHNEAKAAEPLPTEYPAAVVVIPTAEPIVIEDVPVEVTPEPSAEPFTAYIYYIYDVPLEDELQLYIVRLCEEHHIDPAVVMGMAQRESQFTADAIGDGGDALGMWQVQPRWHQDRMDKLGATDLLDPYQCVTVAVDFLSELLDIYDGDIEKALTAYNQGSYKGIVSNYAKTVIENSENIKKGMKQVWYSDDPLKDFNNHDEEQNRWLATLPICADCGEPIQEEYCYEYNDEYICPRCNEDLHRKEVQYIVD